MKRRALITAIITVATLLFAAEQSMAHGQRHAGGHTDAAAGSCLKPIQKKGLMGIGSWENSCSYGVHVRWSIESEEPGTGCTSRPGEPFACLTYVGANTRETAPMSDKHGRGKVRWIACRADNFYSDPWPRVTKVNPDKRVEFNCFHMGFGPGPGAQQAVSKSEMEKALRKTHGQITYSLHQYKEQELARIEREQEREQARARRQWEKQEREWEREEAELAEERRQRNRAMWNQLGKSLGEIIIKRNESNEPSGSGPRGTFIPCGVNGFINEYGRCQGWNQ